MAGDFNRDGRPTWRSSWRVLVRCGFIPTRAKATLATTSEHPRWGPVYRAILLPQSDDQDVGSLGWRSVRVIPHLQGRGDGTFQLAGNSTTLSVQQLSNGKTCVLVANQQTNSVTVQDARWPAPGSSPLCGRSKAAARQASLPPGPSSAELDDNSPLYDAIVVGSSSNDVLVYRGTGFDAAGQPDIRRAR